MAIKLYGTGDVAQQLGLTAGQLQYRLRTGDVTDASHRVSGRRVFTPADVRLLRAQVRILRQERRFRSAIP